MSSRVSVLFLVFALLLLTGVAEHILPVQSQLNAGDIFVIDSEAGTGGKGALFRVGPTTGARTVLSDFGSGANQGFNPEGVAVEASGNILVIDPDDGTSSRGALFRVNPSTGARVLLSDFGSGANKGTNPKVVAVESSGNILVIDADAGTGGLGALFRVDPTTGARTVLSDFGSGANQGADPVGVAVESSGDILVIDPSAGTAGKGALFTVNPTTGARALLSDFGSGANQGADPWGVAVEDSGNILVIDFVAGTGHRGILFRVDPTTGARTVLSDFGSGANQGADPVGVAVESSGNILVIDFGAGTGASGALFRVNPSTGARALLSDFGSGANQGFNPEGVAVDLKGAAVETATGTGTATFQTDSGHFSSLTAVSEGTLPAGGKPDFIFAHGFFSFIITGLSNGQAATITITLPSAAPVGTQFWKYGPTPDNPTDHWYQIPIGDDDGDNVITITITDGGVGDDDLTANGRITDQGGPGQQRIKVVGGVVTPVNKLQILVPYLALAGLVGAATATFTIRKRRRE